jgi:PEP-CTERM motif
MSRLSSALFAGAALAVSGFAAGGASAATFIDNGSLVISTTTYSDTGAVAALNPSSGVAQLPGANAGQSVVPVSTGAFATVFNNDGVDPSFGVTSAITLQDLNASNAQVLNTLTINPNVVSTSFSSKSELGLNIAYTANGPVLTFMGYAGGGVGNLDVSNSDTTAYTDTTNPVTTFFGPSNGGTYAFNRAVVAVSQNGSYTSTQTLAYGGNNGRGAVLATNGEYYTVGNSNNGSGTPSPLTTSTGAEVVTPGSTPNSTMIDPNYQSVHGDKAGKDNNFRGITLYDGAIYFTKGSGSNGIDTVYTETPGTPTVAGAAAAATSILPGFPTDRAKTGPDYTPFGLFFANSTTLYVADEGSGDAADALHAGLEKWSFSGGVWHLDYTLQKGLIGTTYDVRGLNSGVAGVWPTVTTVGLRNLTGRINANGTVTFWATTSTSSASGDNGADPNEIVEITDVLSDSSLPTSEEFSVFDGPQYGLRYGGVALDVPEPATWALMFMGFGGLGCAVRARRRATSLAA